MPTSVLSLIASPSESFQTVPVIFAVPPPVEPPPGGSELLNDVPLTTCVLPTLPVIEPTAPFEIVSRAIVNVPAPLLRRSPHETLIVLLLKVDVPPDGLKPPRIVGLAKFGDVTNVSNSMFALNDHSAD